VKRAPGVLFLHGETAGQRGVGFYIEEKPWKRATKIKEIRTRLATQIRNNRKCDYGSNTGILVPSSRRSR